MPDLFRFLNSRRGLILAVVSLFVLIGFMVASAYKPTCSVLYLVSIGQLPGGRLIQPPNDAVVESMRCLNAPSLPLDKSAGVSPDDSVMWQKTLVMAVVNQSRMLRVSGRAYTAQAAEKLAAYTAGQLVSAHNSVFEAEDRLLAERIALLSRAAEEAASLRREGTAGPRPSAGQFFADWARAEIAAMRHSRETMQRTSLVSAPAAICASGRFHALFYAVVFGGIGFLVALVSVLWLEVWRHERKEGVS